MSRAAFLHLPCDSAAHSLEWRYCFPREKPNKLVGKWGAALLELGAVQGYEKQGIARGIGN